MRRSRVRALNVALGAGTIVFGIVPVVAPGWFGRVFELPLEDEPRLLVMVRSVGARDAAIGAGLLAASLRGRGIRPWLLARLAADWSDALAVAVAVQAGARQPRFVGLGLIALGAAAIGSVLYGLSAKA